MKKCISILVLIGLMLASMAGLALELDKKMMQPNPTETVSSIEEIKEKLGFDINFPEGEMTKKRIYQIIKEFNFAQVREITTDNEITVKKAIAKEDVSNTFDMFKEVMEYEAYGVRVKIKGEKGLVHVLSWQRGEFAFSIEFKNGEELDEALYLLALVNEEQPVEAIPYKR